MKYRNYIINFLGENNIKHIDLYDGIYVYRFGMIKQYGKEFKLHDQKTNKIIQRFEDCFDVVSNLIDEFIGLE